VGTAEQIGTLENVLLRYGKMVVAVSGGMDSTFLACMARRVLGDGMISISVLSEFTIERELSLFGKFAADQGIPHEVIRGDLLGIERVAGNDRDRCYHCKKEIFRLVRDFADKRGIATIADGSNLSDLGEYRPGRRALEELGVVSPLSQAGFYKRTIGSALACLDIDVPVTISNSCLATRVEYGTVLTGEILHRIRDGEAFLNGCGFDPVRLRFHRGVVRIEVDNSYIKKLIFDDEIRMKIVSRLRKLGFTYVTIDMEGFRSGSMDRED